MIFLFASNPFLSAYQESDLIGKLIFLGLIVLSIITWSILIYKMWMLKRVKRDSFAFRKSFFDKRQAPLELVWTRSHAECPNAFYIVYDVLKTKTLELLNKNQKTKKASSYLSGADIDLLGSCAGSSISSLVKYLDKNLYILSTIATLAPFLGLLGTVYGILVSFSGMQGAQGASSDVVLGGLSLALTTTVVGLIDAIPALIGYNYLKNAICDFDVEMNRFATDVLSTFELEYRTVE